MREVVLDDATNEVRLPSPGRGLDGNDTPTWQRTVEEMVNIIRIK